MSLKKSPVAWSLNGEHNYLLYRHLLLDQAEISLVSIFLSPGWLGARQGSFTSPEEKEERKMVHKFIK